MTKKFRHSVKVPSTESLANAATYYLSRYAASEQSLRRVLQNKIRRTAMHNSAFAEDRATQAKLNSTIETIINKYRDSGVLNDALFAENKTRSLRKKGRSRLSIQQTLGIKGLKANIIEEALVRNDEDCGEGSNAELKAAQILARKRKLGPFRTGPLDPDRQRKDLAALARAGFRLDIARKVLSSDISDEELF